MQRFLLLIIAASSLAFARPNICEKSTEEHRNALLVLGEGAKEHYKNSDLDKRKGLDIVLFMRYARFLECKYEICANANPDESCISFINTIGEDASLTHLQPILDAIKKNAK